MILAEITGVLHRLLEENHYNPATIDFYDREWRKLDGFLVHEYGDHEFDMDRGMRYLEQEYGIITNHQDGTLTQQRVQLIRVVQMLEDYKNHGVLTRRIHANKNPIQLNSYYNSLLSDYLHYMDRTSLSASSQTDYKGCILVFLDYLQQTGIKSIENVTMDTIVAFEKTLAGYSPKTVEQKVCALRHFLRFTQIQELTNGDLADKIHVPSISKQAKVPSAWELDELKAMIAAIDRNSAIGKRDYAMILLACVLGIRSGDIKRLCFSNFDWNTGVLSFVQHKTHMPVSLPLPKEVAWAVIDYIRNSRPRVVDTDIVFVKHMPPFDPMDESNHMNQIIKKYANKAGLDLRKKHRSGFHSLRHSAASMMLEMGTPLPTITNVLGHSDPNITAVYLKTDVQRLSECVLDPGDYAISLKGNVAKGDQQDA